MPHAAVHKSKQKSKSRSAGGVEYEYARRLHAVDEDEDVPIGRITKIENARDRAVITFYDAKKKQIVEVRAGIPDKNIQRLGPSVGSYIVPVESGKNKYEIFLILSDEDARRRTDRVHKSILNFSYGGGSSSTIHDDCGIEFEAEEESKPESTEEVKSKKDKVSKHTERLLREEVDDGDDVNVDDI